MEKKGAHENRLTFLRENGNVAKTCDLLGDFRTLNYSLLM
jgi:hypothetical protein